MELQDIDTSKRLHRVAKIKGQINAIERAIEQERGCSYILQLLTSVRGSMDSFFIRSIELHIGLKLSGTDENVVDDLMKSLKTSLRS
jgi:DNA-binding FrmR family transcriptional regulator